MIKVGVTGGIGSGKSLICHVFSHLGIPIYTADEAAKNLMDHDPDIIKGLTRIFGNTVYADGKLNRKMLSDLIFDDPVLLADINRVVHPVVRNNFLDWCGSFTSVPFVIQESAILFENKALNMFDYIILVTSPPEIRIQRVLRRLGMTREKVMRIMKNQLSEEEKIVGSHFIINNDESTLILPLILSIYNEISKL
jgi:dephospho-CoA kinase